MPAALDDSPAALSRQSGAESWAVANGRSIQFSYTLPSTTSGLDSSGLAVPQNAVRNNAAPPDPSRGAMGPTGTPGGPTGSPDPVRHDREARPWP
jgi:hypothetical protein